jgi:hypothetical protein
VESSSIGSVSHRLVLQVALSTLVTDGAVERVVGEEELHDSFPARASMREMGHQYAVLRTPNIRF